MRVHEGYHTSSNGNSEKSEPQMGFEPTILSDLVWVLTTHHWRLWVVGEGEMSVETSTASRRRIVNLTAGCG